MRMTLEDYIAKYGVESGTKRFNGVIKLLKSRKKTYESQPFVRFTKEWFIWKYPKDGAARFQEHINKSRQSEKNMILRWGEELGKKKWQETLLKKNTRKLVKEQKGEDALLKFDQKRNQKLAEFWKNLSDDERKQKIKDRTSKSLETKKRKYGGKKKLEIFLEMYGVEQGHIEYANFLRKIFKSIGSSRESSNLIKSIISDHSWLTSYELFYRDPDDPTKVEWFISNKEGVWFYDFCVREAKAILEYNGAKWHPTEEQVSQFGDEIMEILGVSFRHRYQKDLNKIKVAEDRGFKVFVIRSDFTIEQKTNIIRDFIVYIKEKLNG